MSQESHFFDDPDALEDGVIPPEENPIVSVNIDNVRDGDDDNDGVVDNPGSPEPVLPPIGRGVISKIKFAVVSALGSHEVVVKSANALGKEVTHIRKSKDVFEIEQRDFAERRLTESKNKWDPKAMEGLNGFQKFGKNATRFFDRVWRGMGSEEAHRAKEKAFGSELSATIGIDTAISEEFNAVIDKAARKRISEQRNTKGKQFWGGVKDAWAEFRGARRDLHSQELIVTQELRQKYDADPTNSDPAENPLYSLINRDVAARESLAARVNESDLELLKQTNAGDKKTTVGIKLEGPEGQKVEKFLKGEIIGKAINDFTSRKDQGENVTGINAKLRRELDLKLQDYFMTDEFTTWRNTLPADQQALFENSFTYASDMLLQTEEVMLPSVLENLDHYKGTEKLNFEMELCLGTAQLSANTEETKDNWFTKERASLNQKLMDRMRGERNTTPNSRIYDTQVIQSGLKWQRTMSYVDMIAKNEALVAWGTAIAGKGALTAARSGLSWIPGVGSALVAGTASGLKEWARMGKQRATFGFGEANGLEFPIADQAVRSEQMRKADYHRIQLGRRTQQFMGVMDKFKEGNPDANTIFMGMAYVADSGARLKLNGERNINLLTASVDGPEGRGIYARELRVHDLARSALTKQLGELLADDTKRGEIANMMGVAAGQPNDCATLLAKLTEGQYNNLLDGTQVDGAIKALITSGDPELIRQQSEAIMSRDKIFNKMRWGSTVKYAATSAAIAGVAQWGLGKAFHHEESIVATGTENHTVVLVNHALPTQEDLLHPTAHILDDHGNVLTETHSWLPAGTHLEAVTHRIGPPDSTEMATSYNLVTDNTKNDVLLHGITFGPHGEIQNQAQLLAEETKNHITITPHNLSPVTWGTDGTSTTTTELNPANWHNNIVWGEQPGMSQGGVDGWVAHNLGGYHTPSGVERVTEISGVRQVWKGLEDDLKNQNMHINQIPEAHRVIHYVQSVNGPQALSAPQADNLEITNLPDLLGTVAGHVKLAGLVDESVKMHAALQPGQSLDRLHQVIWEASYWGDEAHVPHGADLKLILEWAGETTTTTTPETLHSVIPVENIITLTQDLTTVVPVHTNEVFTQTVADMWTHLAAVGYSHPLEAPMGHVMPFITPDPNDKDKDKDKNDDKDEYEDDRPKNKAGKRGSKSIRKEIDGENYASHIRPIVSPIMMDDEKSDQTSNVISDQSKINIGADDQAGNRNSDPKKGHNSQVVGGKLRGNPVNRKIIKPTTEQVEQKVFDQYEEPELKIDSDLASAIDNLAKTISPEEDEEEKNENAQEKISS